jgi:cytochrome c5
MKPIAISTILYFAILTDRSIFQTRQRKVSKDAPIPNETMAMSSKVSIETLQTGHGVYMRRCGECHTHLLPNEVSTADWHIVVPRMAWNAGINPEDEKALLKYLIAAKSPTKYLN